MAPYHRKVLRLRRPKVSSATCHAKKKAIRVPAVFAHPGARRTMPVVASRQSRVRATPIGDA